MGNADLRDLAVIEEVEDDAVAGADVAVDAPHWLYRYLTTTARFTDDEVYTTADGEELPNLIGVPRGLKRFFEHDISPVFVFDGTPDELKSDEVDARREAKEEAAKKAEEARERGDAIAAARYEARTQRLTGEVIGTTKDLLDLFDIPYIEAPREAEAQAAHMAAAGLVDHAVSGDYDTMLFGSPSTMRNFTSASRPLERIGLDATLDELDLTREKLVDVAILCGTDFNDGVHGVGVKTALKGVREHGSAEAFLDERGDEVENLSAVQTIFLDPPVAEVDIDSGLSVPDIDGVRAYLDDRGVDTGPVESTLDDIDEYTSQPGLDNWG